MSIVMGGLCSTLSFTDMVYGIRSPSHPFGGNDDLENLVHESNVAVRFHFNRFVKDVIGILGNINFLTVT